MIQGTYTITYCNQARLKLIENLIENNLLVKQKCFQRLGSVIITNNIIIFSKNSIENIKQ